jgi:hypothetical protein
MRISTMKSGTAQLCCAALAAFVLGACDGGPNVEGGAQPVATQDTGATAPDVANEADTAGLADNGSAAVCTAQEQLELYDRRIKPLVDGTQPSSCNQCHLSGVDLAMFVQKSPCETMACLAKQGLVDLKNPAASKILEQVKLAKPQSSLITQAVIDAEYKGFLEWITFAGTCMDEVCGKIDDACLAPSTTEGETGGAKDVLGGCTEQELGESFQKNVWHWRGRCQPCHIPPGSEKWQTKQWIDGNSNTAKSAADKYKAALFTMYNLIGINAVNADKPEKSSFILNPLAPAAGGLPHEGHVKIANKSEQTYKDFLKWATQYSECKKKVK